MAEGFTLQVQGISDALWEPIDLVIPSTRPATKVVGRGYGCVTSRAHFVCSSHRLSVESDAPQLGYGSAIHAYFQAWV